MLAYDLLAKKLVANILSHLMVEKPGNFGLSTDLNINDYIKVIYLLFIYS